MLNLVVLIVTNWALESCDGYNISYVTQHFLLRAILYLKTVILITMKNIL